MRIALDAMGGDFAPKVAVEGAILAKKSLPQDYQIVLLGPEDIIISLLEANGVDKNDFIIHHSPQVIEMAENPTKAFQQKQDSSIANGFKLLAGGKVDAFCSAGNTGAMMVGSIFTIKAVKGVLRPVIAGFFPQFSGKYGIIVDVGANADCKPEMLAQFAELGSLFVKYFYNIENPKVGIMSLGEEDEKGTITTLAAFKLIKENPRVNFVGNLEGRDVMTDKADVIVCDGLLGNVMLKLGESMYPMLKEKGFVDDFIELFNYENMAGSPILGANGNVIIGHGSSKAFAIKNMILTSIKMAESGISKKIKEAYDI